MATKTILMLEDDELLISIFRMSLELDGYKVIEAHNGRVALDLLLALEPVSLPDCILLDIMMPVMDGHAFLGFISGEYKDQFGHIPVVVCSAHGKYEATPQVVAKLTKPISLLALGEMMERVINLKEVLKNPAEIPASQSL